MAIAFPSTPTTGQTYSYQGKTWQYNGTGWRQITGSGPGIAVQVFTANGTYTPAVGMRYCIIEAVGAGGGGAGRGSGNTTTGHGAGGGGAGTLSIKYSTADEIGTSQTVTIGIGGTGGIGNNAGSNGSNTSVGSLCTAPGGSGAPADSYSGDPGAGGSGGVGDISVPGQNGESGVGASITTITPFGGNGGSTRYGRGGMGGQATGTAAQASGGSTGAGYGAGGGGALTYASAADRNGGNGTDGVVIITEFLGEAYGAFTSDQHAIGDISVTFDATVKAGHVELDGSTITDGASDYPILATRYPWMVSGNDLILPDTRGRTLRGWDHGAGTDPGAGSRTARAGDGATGDNPGTYQADAFQGHRHASLYQAVVNTGGFPIDNGGPGTWSSTSTFVANPTTDGTNGTPRTSSETRMININVTFQMRII